jgi:hypothetical protein
MALLEDSVGIWLIQFSNLLMAESNSAGSRILYR